ncbi:hypothetical protein K9M78_01050 [Candidatus Bipolaricaulota bacterium]|nr:hypothetical protein [Candidatus Bipolaricaulota bacterium]
MRQLTKPYRVSSQKGEAYVFFRYSELSDNISFSYGNKSTSYAVDDFIEELKEIKENLANPREKLVTIAVDGENWMFMAGYPNNGRSFLEELYRELEKTEWVKTTTPGKFIESQKGETTEIDKLATGSWAGDLSTWRGEPEEDRAWRRLIEARQAIQEEPPGSPARNAILAAEGSDWFWWYGTDKDSGNDEIFDGLFKTHLINSYRQSGYSREDIPAELFVDKSPPIAENLGGVKVTLDGTITSEEEWRNAVHFQTDASEIYTDLYLGYGPNDLFVRIDTVEEARKYIGQDLSFNLYLSGETRANARTRYGETKLGFPLSQMVSLHMEDVEADGTWNVFRYRADGKRNWKFASSISNLSRRVAEVGEIIEFKFPYETINIEPEENFTLRLSAERRKAGTQLTSIPERPVRTRIPKPLSGTRVFTVNDPEGDDYGPGNYSYPKNSVFDHEGLFDLRKYEIYDAGDKWLLSFEFGAMTNPWDAPLGFSHQLINLYIDSEKGGKVEPRKEGAGVRFSSEATWDYFVKIAGWPGYGRELVTADGEGYKIDVSSNVKQKRVIAGIPKELLPEIDGNHYLMVFSQDGYGRDHIRTVQKEASTWQGGGAKHPSVSSNVYDYLAPAGEQKNILSSYDRTEKKYATLKPFKVSPNPNTGGGE